MTSRTKKLVKTEVQTLMDDIVEKGYKTPEAFEKRLNPLIKEIRNEIAAINADTNLSHNEAYVKIRAFCGSLNETAHELSSMLEELVTFATTKYKLHYCDKTQANDTQQTKNNNDENVTNNETVNSNTDEQLPVKKTVKKIVKKVVEKQAPKPEPEITDEPEEPQPPVKKIVKKVIEKQEPEITDELEEPQPPVKKIVKKKL